MWGKNCPTWTMIIPTLSHLVYEIMDNGLCFVVKENIIRDHMLDLFNMYFMYRKLITNHLVQCLKTEIPHSTTVCVILQLQSDYRIPFHIFRIKNRPVNISCKSMLLQISISKSQKSMTTLNKCWCFVKDNIPILQSSITFEGTTNFVLKKLHFLLTLDNSYWTTLLLQLFARFLWNNDVFLLSKDRLDPD